MLCYVVIRGTQVFKAAVPNGIVPPLNPLFEYIVVQVLGKLTVEQKAVEK